MRNSTKTARGRDDSWFRAAQVRHEGHNRAGGVEKDVIFMEETDPGTSDQIDAAYRAKDSHYPQYIASMVTPAVRADARHRTRSYA